MSYASERSLLTGLRIGQALSAPLQDYMNQKRQREWELQDQETRRGDRAQSVQDQLALQVAMGNLAGFQKAPITPASGDRPATVGAIPVQMDASGQPTAYEQNRSPIAVGMGSLIDPQENATFQALKAEQEAKARDQALRSQLAMKNEFDVKGATAKAEALEPFEIRKQQREADEKRGFMDIETTNQLNRLEKQYQLAAQNQDNDNASKLANDIAVLREKARLEQGNRGKTKALSDGERNALLSAAGSVRTLNNAITDYDKLNKSGLSMGAVSVAGGQVGPLAGRASAVKSWLGIGNEEFEKFNTQLQANLFTTARSLQGAGVLTEQDIKRMEAIAPTGKISRDAFLGKLNGMREVMLNRLLPFKQFNYERLSDDEKMALDSAIEELSGKIDGSPKAQEDEKDPLGLGL